VLLKPLPYTDADRIVMVMEKPPQGERNGISTLNYLDWKAQNKVFEFTTAFRYSRLFRERHSWAPNCLGKLSA
jgi:putative ABC transport system permease protein